MVPPAAVEPDPAGSAATSVPPLSARETAPDVRSGPATTSSATSSDAPHRPKPPNPFAGDADYLGPISATPQKMVSVMLRVAGVGEGDVVFDLGCNDGRVPITAAVAFGATGVGVEIDGRPCGHVGDEGLAEAFAAIYTDGKAVCKLKPVD